jgi:precorrin-6A/cobalt-precorrin-6A reductase
MRDRRILILGGTSEARELARLIADAGGKPVTSLAGVTQNPAKSAGTIRTGGFGGVEGLVAYLERENFDAIADATHPFAAQISSHAAGAARSCGIPIARLERPLWQAGPGDRWFSFASCESAAAALGSDARVLLTVGRKELLPFFSRPKLGGVARMIELPAIPVPARWTIIRDRPPFALADELKLIDRETITVLVTKNSGGDDTRAKLDAARLRGIPVYLIERPRKPDVATAATPDALFALLSSLLWA